MILGIHKESEEFQNPIGLQRESAEMRKSEGTEIFKTTTGLIEENSKYSRHFLIGIIISAVLIGSLVFYGLVWLFAETFT